VPEPPPAAEIPEDPQADARARDLVARAVAPAARLSALEIHGRLRAIDRPEDFRLTCTAHLLVQRPDRLRLRASKALGMDILDLAMAGGAIDIWLPRRHTLYRGRVDELGSTGVSFQPRAIVAQLLFPAEELRQRRWHLWTEDDEAAVVLEVSEARYLERLTIDPADGRLLRRELLRAADGSVYMEVVFTRFAPLESLAGAPLFPRRVDITFPQEERELALAIRRILPNPELSEQDFRLTVEDPDAVVKPLRPERETDAPAADLREALRDDAGGAE
jgi:hypothetical protein